MIEYSAVTAMIAHEDDDHGGKNWIGYSSTLRVTLSSDCLACATICGSIDVRRERSLTLKSHIVMSRLAIYISDSSNIECVGIVTFIYMLNELHIISV